MTEQSQLMQEDCHITMDQLRIGLYVVLDLSWFEHPFPFGHFKIKSEQQIEAIRSLGLERIRYRPTLSDVRPLPPAIAGEETQGPFPDSPSPEIHRDIAPALAAKRAMRERIRLQRDAAACIEDAFISSARRIRDIEKNVFSQPAEAVRQATALIGQITDSILCSPDLAIHVMGDKTGSEELYFHSLNVTMLSMMMARDIRLPREVARILGMGALFHDIGLKEIPTTVLAKTDPLTPGERSLYEMHCQYGVKIGERMELPRPVLSIIREHHELFDGSGYPEKLKGESAGLLSRIVAIADYYDELCNPARMADALTPHEALSTMFAKLRSKFDPKLLQVFIRCLGVYPPGTIVQLSNGAIAMIATVNTASPMKPLVVVYDPNIPRDEAILVDLACDSDLTIAKAIRPAQVSTEIHNYLSPRKRVSYYFDAGKTSQEPMAK